MLNGEGPELLALSLGDLGVIEVDPSDKETAETLTDYLREENAPLEAWQSAAKDLFEAGEYLLVEKVLKGAVDFFANAGGGSEKPETAEIRKKGRKLIVACLADLQMAAEILGHPNLSTAAVHNFSITPFDLDQETLEKISEGRQEVLRMCAFLTDTKRETANREQLRRSAETLLRRVQSKGLKGGDQLPTEQMRLKICAGNHLFANKRFPEALAMYQGVLGEHPDCPVNVRFAIGLCFSRLQQYAFARQAMERVLSLDPDHVEALCALSSLQEETPDGANKGRKLLERAVAVGGQSHPLVALSLANAAFAKGLSSRAGEFLRPFGVVEVRGGDVVLGGKGKVTAGGTASMDVQAEAKFQVARLLHESKRFPEAETMLKEVLKALPNHLPAAFHLAQCLLGCSQAREHDWKLKVIEAVQTVEERLVPVAGECPDVLRLAAACHFEMARIVHEGDQGLPLPPPASQTPTSYAALTPPTFREKGKELFSRAVAVAPGSSARPSDYPFPAAPRELLLKALTALEKAAKRPGGESDHQIHLMRARAQMWAMNMPQGFQSTPLIQGCLDSLQKAQEALTKEYEKKKEEGEEETLEVGGPFLTKETGVGVPLVVLNNIAALKLILNDTQGTRALLDRCEAATKKRLAELREAREKRGVSAALLGTRDGEEEVALVCTQVALIMNSVSFYKQTLCMNEFRSRINELNAICPKFTPSLTMRWQQDLQRGELDGVVRNLLKWQKDNTTKDPDIMLLRAQVTLRLGSVEAAEHFCRAVQDSRTFKNDAHACTLLALCELHKAMTAEDSAQSKRGAMHLQKAGFYFRGAIKLNPHNVPAALGAGVVLAESGHLDEASHIFRSVLETRMPEWEYSANLNLGHIHAALACDEQLRKKLRGEGDDATLPSGNRKATAVKSDKETQIDQGMLERAKAYYEAALAKKPRDRQAILSLGLLFLESSTDKFPRHAEAVEILEQGLSMWPWDMRFLYNLQLALQMLLAETVLAQGKLIEDGGKSFSTGILLVSPAEWEGIRERTQNLVDTLEELREHKDKSVHQVKRERELRAQQLRRIGAPEVSQRSVWYDLHDSGPWNHVTSLGELPDPGVTARLIEKCTLMLGSIERFAPALKLKYEQERELVRAKEEERKKRMEEEKRRRDEEMKRLEKLRRDEETAAFKLNDMRLKIAGNIEVQPSAAEMPPPAAAHSGDEQEGEIGRKGQKKRGRDGKRKKRGQQDFDDDDNEDVIAQSDEEEESADDQSSPDEEDGGDEEGEGRKRKKRKTKDKRKTESGKKEKKKDKKEKKKKKKGRLKSAFFEDDEEDDDAPEGGPSSSSAAAAAASLSAGGEGGREGQDAYEDLLREDDEEQVEQQAQTRDADMGVEEAGGGDGDGEDLFGDADADAAAAPVRGADNDEDEDDLFETSD
uniref:Uncharacterized protein n=1 Tax=Chromera velia CCMP2878 TaxID=1169474 RepID=A0A0G4GSD6_9ALVE|eukprot:Cvel_5141.t1-p1 / transcript=Cvel_5141.t1 / gene=Cvel_5141 / organism=Chromera_velia_CCMP2878 / gene_product=RNA polymerase-associated protein CTR9 homolog, putative / transcript_product=RNA polymerase-associated protein CTR9 homolog, putative / location=Cvel_scaffold235:60432-70936(-) / protein_length=1409 / sequence_SO=supercontig / SO=protein_coding / is_pseudo=false